MLSKKLHPVQHPCHMATDQSCSVNFTLLQVAHAASVSHCYRPIMQHHSHTATDQSCSIMFARLQTMYARLVIVHLILSLAPYAPSFTLTPVSQSEARVLTSGLPSELRHQPWPVSQPPDWLLTDITHPAALGTHPICCLVYMPSLWGGSLLQLPVNLDR